MRAIQLEKIILKDGWYKVGQTGSHRQYKHPEKPGKKPYQYTEET